MILIADEIVDTRQMYAEYLEFVGYRVEQARTGQEAVALAQALVPALIVMDLSMPDIDGCEATRRLKADVRTSTIPVVVVSGHVMGPVKERAIAAGADAFVTKPCLPDDLSTKIAGVLATRGSAPPRH